MRRISGGMSDLVEEDIDGKNLRWDVRSRRTWMARISDLGGEDHIPRRQRSEWGGPRIIVFSISVVPELCKQEYEIPGFAEGEEQAKTNFLRTK